MMTSLNQYLAGSFSKDRKIISRTRRSLINDEASPPGTGKGLFPPGELCVTEKPVLIATLLGSCVAVCVYNRKTGAAGMNDFLRDRVQAPNEPCGKFGDSSTSYLLKSLLAMDPAAAHLEAKIFGGGKVTGNLGLAGAGIGKDNIAVARAVIEKLQKLPLSKRCRRQPGQEGVFQHRTFRGESPVLIASRHKD